MGVQLQIRPLYFIILLFLSYTYFKKEVTPSYNHFLLGYDPQAISSYFTATDQYGKQLKDFILGMDIITSTSISAKIVNVDDFGATADGTDDTEAFENAWKEACHRSKGGAVLEVPEGKSYLLKHIRFLGPCMSNLTVRICGTIEASENRSDYNSQHWLAFAKVDNLLIEGGGIINGNGKIWWENSCKIKKNNPCKKAPTALTFSKSKNLVVKNLNIKDAQQIHVTFYKCTNVEASGLTITAPKRSPNTDGIHISHTQNIRLTNSVIGTGDDCISIVSGSQNVQAMDITCGPGHGISIGSLGRSKYKKAYVSGVIVDRAKLFETTNGVRIKTWQGGSGSASNIKFQNIEMYKVTNPIIIDQNYCDQHEPCKEQSSAVEVKNVVYKNIKGTSASDVAIKFDCSQTYPCQGIVLQNVNLQKQGNKSVRAQKQGNKSVRAMCNNVKWIVNETVFPQCTSQEQI